MTNRGEQSPAQWQGSPLERKPKSAAALGRGARDLASGSPGCNGGKSRVEEMMSMPGVDYEVLPIWFVMFTSTVGNLIVYQLNSIRSRRVHPAFNQ